MYHKFLVGGFNPFEEWIMKPPFFLGGEKKKQEKKKNMFELPPPRIFISLRFNLDLWNPLPQPTPPTLPTVLGCQEGRLDAAG